jgi:hypothetical protein
LLKSQLDQFYLKQLKVAANTTDPMLAASSSNESEEGIKLRGETVLADVVEYDFDNCFEKLLASNSMCSSHKTMPSQSRKTVNEA